MKHYCTLLFIAALSFSANAQINKSDKLFGGSFNGNFFNNSRGPNPVQTGNIGFAPSFGWAIKKNLVMGLKGSIGYSRSENINGSVKTISSGISILPGIFFTRYKQLKKQFGVTFTNEVFAGYGQSKLKTATGEITSDSRSAGYSFSPGVYYRFSDHFFGQASFGGAYATWQGAENTNTFNAGVSFLQAFQVGINYRIGKRNG